MLPRISIVMPCRNGAQYVATAVASIERQAYPNLECLVFDACSTDGTLEILSRHPAIEVISEPDNGAHEALNKGVAHAGGEVIGFLAVDDLYPEGALLQVGQLFAARPDIDVVVGHSLVFCENDRGVRSFLFNRKHQMNDGLWLPELTFGVPGFFGCFFRRRVLERVGLFDASYDFAGDRHFLIRVALNGLRAARLDAPTIHYRMHMDSRTINQAMRNLLEISAEYVRMSLELAGTKGVVKADRDVFLAWHAFESVKLGCRLAKRGKLVAGARITAESVSAQPVLAVSSLSRSRVAVTGEGARPRLVADGGDSLGDQCDRASATTERHKLRKNARLRIWGK